jgi:alpha-tubulin suppressor-like RCC1 family protein
LARRPLLLGRAATGAGLCVLALGLASCSNSGPTVSAPTTTTSGGGGHHAATSTTSTTGAPRTAGTALSWGEVGSKGKLPGGHRRPVPVTGILGTVTSIATSNSDSYALTSAGQVWAWGAGAMGELGNGTTPQVTADAVQVEFPPGVTITSLPNPMPFDGGLAIDSQGDLWGWGVNTANELCLPGPSVVLRPTQLPVHGVTLATGAARHIMFDAGGTVYACGQGQSGQLGTGTFRRAPTPVAVVGLPAVGVKALTSSWMGSGALMDDGSYYDWGYNATGQLGNGTTTNSAVPVHVPLPAPVAQASMGGSTAANGQTIVLLTNGDVWTWGNGAFGQMGNGTTVSSLSPIQVTPHGGARWVFVNSGGYASYAIDATGTLWSWGRNDAGQLGTGRRPAPTATPIHVGVTMTQVSSTADNVAGLR